MAGSMMASNHHHVVFYHSADDARGAAMATATAAAYPQSPCDTNSGIQVSMAMLTVEGYDDDGLSAKENVCPNHGRRNKWRKNRRVAAASDDRDSRRDRAKAAAPPEQEGSRDDPESKTKKAVVVDISSQKQHRRPPAVRRILPPSIDLDAAAEAEDASSPASSNEISSSGRQKKTKYKSRRYPMRRKPRSKRGGAAAGVEDYAPNAGGTSVLSLLGQYPYAMALATADPTYGAGSSPPQGPRGGDFYHHVAPYDPSSGAGVPPHAYAPYHTHQCAQHPYPAAVSSPDAYPHGATHVAPAAVGYYVPVMMPHPGGGVAYYDPWHAPLPPGAGYPPYDNYDASGHATFGGAPCGQPPPPGHREPSGAPSGRALNIDAPAFSPKEKRE